jgi:hypothetical protein
MCVRIKYKNGNVKKYDPDKEIEEQVRGMESVKVEGRLTAKERKVLLFLAKKEIRSNQDKLEQKFEEIKMSLREVGKK